MSFASTWRQDVKLGIRSLYKHAGHTIVTLVTLVLAIAAVTTVTTLIRQVVLKPLPAPAADELVFVEIRNTESGSVERSESIPFETFRDWRDARADDVDIAWAVIESSVLTETDIGVYSAGHYVSHNFLSVIGIEPQLGRWFSEEEAGQPVVVISHDMWRQDLDADPSVIGRTISLDRRPFTVVGVMPEGYAKFIEPRVRYWRPVDDYGRGGSVIGRLRSERTPVTLERIGSAFDRVLQRSVSQSRVELVPLKSRIVGQTESDLWLLGVAVCALFLVGLLNVTNLTLARFGGRIHELTTRAILGATRLGLIRQLIVETVILSLLAAVASILVTTWLLDLALRLMPEAFPRRQEISIDAWAWLIALIAAMLSGLLAALIPSVRVSSPARLLEHLKHSSSRFASTLASVRLRRWLIASQIGVALPLLVAVGLLTRSYIKLLDEYAGFDPSRVVTGHIWRPEGLSDAEYAAAHERTLDAIANLPEIGLVAAGSTIPMAPLPTRVDPSISYSYSGQPALRPGEESRAFLRTVSNDFFRVLGIPLVAGRFFDGREATSPTRTVIVNQALVDRIWPGESAIGRELTLLRQGQNLAYAIVGVIADYRFDDLSASVKPEVFLAMSQTVFGGASYVARATTDDPRAAMQAMARVASSLDNSMPMIELRTMEDLVTSTADSRQAVLSILFGFAACATLLAGVGIYGLTSYLIGLRRQEIALRIALGADRGWIRLWVIKGAIVPAAVGTVVGFVVTLLLARLLETFLYGIDARDWPAYAGALIVILAVALIAPVGPAARAARVEPSLVLQPD